MILNFGAKSLQSQHHSLSRGDRYYGLPPVCRTAQTRTDARLGTNIIGELLDMAKDKIDVTLKLERNHLEWLNAIVGQYDLVDESKAARVLFDYAIGDVDHELIFANENARCRHCG